MLNASLAGRPPRLEICHRLLAKKATARENERRPRPLTAGCPRRLIGSHEINSRPAAAFRLIVGQFRDGLLASLFNSPYIMRHVVACA
jgi:hypothetical protein